MHEKLAWIEGYDLIGRHPAVRTSDPQVFGGLLAGEPVEKAGISLLTGLGPETIVFNQVIKGMSLRHEAW
jgi:hypothetical protein